MSETDPVLVLRRKYELVHLPSRKKVERWRRKTLDLIDEGYPKEQAGMVSAKAVFTYEYHEHRVYNEVPVEDILRRFAQEG
jgi:hypothetical protein